MSKKTTKPGKCEFDVSTARSSYGDFKVYAELEDTLKRVGESCLLLEKLTSTGPSRQLEISTEFCKKCERKIRYTLERG